MPVVKFAFLLAEWRAWATAGGWHRLALVFSGVWAALVVLLGLASSDPGQNHLARLLILPIIGLWCLGYAINWATRAPRPQEPELPLPSPADSAAATHAAPLHEQQPTLWWASVLIYVAAVFGAFALQWGPQGNDLLHQSARILGSTLVIAALAGVVYTRMGPQTSIARAKLLLVTASIGAAFVLWQALDDTHRLRSVPAPLASEPTAAKEDRAAAVSTANGKSRPQASSRAAAVKSAPPDTTAWETAVSEAIARHNLDYLAATSKWESDVEKLRFESMLTPATLTSPAGREQNRRKLAQFEDLLAGFLSGLEGLQQDYRASVLAIDIPASQREGFIREFERGFAASVVETKALNAEFERVELAIAQAILDITDLMEREEDEVAVGSDGKTLLFQNNAAANEYNALLQTLAKITDEEGVVMTKTSEAFRRRTQSLDSATGRR